MSAGGAGFLWISACHAIELWQINLIAFAELAALSTDLSMSTCFGGETGMDVLRSHSSHIVNYPAGNFAIGGRSRGMSGIKCN